MTVLVGPATIALVVDLLLAPPRFLQSGDDDGIPLGSRKTVQGCFHHISGRKAGSNESGRSGGDVSSTVVPLSGPRPTFRVSGVKEVIDLC